MIILIDEKPAFLTLLLEFTKYSHITLKLFAQYFNIVFPFMPFEVAKLSIT